jgi:uncharacterized protein
VNVVDANVLLYAVNSDSDRHVVSRRWLDDALSGGATVGLSWIALLAFVRLATKRGLFATPLDTSEAIDRVQAWLGAPGAVVVEPTAAHLTVVRDLLSAARAGGNLVNDAHLAALAIEHRGSIVSFDSDFDRFPGVSRFEPVDR